MKSRTVVVSLILVAMAAASALSVEATLYALPAAALLLTVVIASARPRALAWRFAALGSALWTVEEIGWLIQRTSGTNVPTTITDIGYYAGSALWLAALLSMPGRRFPTLLTLPFLPALGLIVWLYVQNVPRTLDLQFPIVDIVLVVFAAPALESALRGRAPEARLLWVLGFVVRALTAGASSWLYAVPGLTHAFYLLWLFPYAFLALGATLELDDVAAGLWSTGAAVVGLEAVTAVMLTLLYRGGDIDRPYTFGIVLLLAYVQFASIMLLLLSDRRRRIRAEDELKAWGPCSTA